MSINQEIWQNQLLWNRKLFFSFKNEAGYLNFLSDSILLTIFDFSLPGAHKNTDLLLFMHLRVNVILKKSFLLIKLTFLLIFLFILFLNNDAI